MSEFDYMKVLELVAQRFAIEGQMDFKSTSKPNFFEIGFTSKSGEVRAVQVFLAKYQMTVVFSLDYLSRREMDEWIVTFEYQLEQIFMTNIKLDVQQDDSNYRIKIEY